MHTLLHPQSLIDEVESNKETKTCELLKQKTSNMQQTKTITKITEEISSPLPRSACSTLPIFDQRRERKAKAGESLKKKFSRSFAPPLAEEQSASFYKRLQIRQTKIKMNNYPSIAGNETLIRFKDFDKKLNPKIIFEDSYVLALENSFLENFLKESLKGEFLLKYSLISSVILNMIVFDIETNNSQLIFGFYFASLNCLFNLLLIKILQ